LQQLEHQRHRHGSSAVWDDRKQTFAAHLKLVNSFSDDFANLVSREIS
jgi:hypothetical protein